MTNPRFPLGMNTGAGYQPYTAVGNQIQGLHASQDRASIDNRRILTGVIKDILLPTEDNPDDTIKAVRVKIKFKTKAIDRTYGGQWFYLNKDTSELIADYGTKESILRKNIAVNLLVRGVNFKNAIVEVVGPRTRDYRYTGYTSTPIMAWGDLFNGLMNGGAAS